MPSLFGQNVTDFATTELPHWYRVGGGELLVNLRDPVHHTGVVLNKILVIGPDLSDEAHNILLLFQEFSFFAVQLCFPRC
jgi:hypothetical protein